MALRKYPWEEWFGQPRTVLRRGTDYHISTAMMYQTVKNNASRYMVRVRLRDIGDILIIEMIGVRSASTHPDKVTVAN